ncbi:type 3 dihydrofolate reductase [Niabella terrae]
MNISLVAAASENNVIGKNNQLVWNLPDDMKHFKNVTWGMPVVMGRKTFESFKRPLPGRKNIVLSNNKDLKIDGAIVSHSMKDVEFLVREMDVRELMVIGGGEIYKMYYPRANKIYLTRVHAVLEGDTYFPAIEEKDWQLVSTIHNPADQRHTFAFDYERWERR